MIDNQFSRRNLTTFTRGELALKLKPIVAERAKERMSEGGEKAAPGRPAEKGVAELPHLSTGKTRDVLASRAGMSGKTLDKVEAILASPHFTPNPSKGTTDHASCGTLRRTAEMMDTFYLLTQKQSTTMPRVACSLRCWYNVTLTEITPQNAR